MRSIILFICLCICSEIFAQSDSLRNQILRYQEPKTEIITKGRNMTLSKFLENDKKKVTELLDYLINNEEDEHHLAFYPMEKWLLYYWTGQFNEVIDDVKNYDSDYEASRFTRIGPQHDLLLVKLKENLSEQRDVIKYQIHSSALDDTEKEFLQLHFDLLLMENSNGHITQDSLNQSANQFLLAHPNSMFEAFIRKYIRFELKPSKWGFAFEFFSGYGVFTGDLAKNFKNNVPIGIAFDISYKNFVLYLRDYIGFSKTTDSIQFKNGTWRGDAQARVFLPEASLGFVTVDNDWIKIVPFAGISSTDVGPTENDKNKIPEYEDLGLQFTTTYTVGLNLDLKLGRSRQPIVTMGHEQSYWLLRIRYAYNRPQFDWKYKGFSGDFHYVTIGIGAFGRTIKRDY